MVAVLVPTNYKPALGQRLVTMPCFFAKGKLRILFLTFLKLKRVYNIVIILNKMSLQISNDHHNPLIRLKKISLFKLSSSKIRRLAKRCPSEVFPSVHFVACRN